MKIYRKLYLWFLLVFVLTIAVVILIVNRFYTERVKDELHAQLQTHAKFLLDEYQDACVVRDSDSCKRFLRRLEQIRPVRFWILNNSGQVLLANSKGGPPKLSPSDISKAQKGEAVITFRHRDPPYILIPLKGATGTVQEHAIVERAFIGGRRFRRFPFFASLLVALITIALLIFPLSKRLTRPLRELHQLGNDWAEGRLEKRAIIQGKDEIAELAVTFNTMAENLQRMLQQRKEFMAAISHELKSPLARMRIALELLHEKNDEPGTKKLLNNIEQEMEESERLIEQLLVLSRVEMNAPLSKDVVPLEMLTRRAVEQLQPLADRASVQFKIQGNATVVADYTQLERAFLNVLENAIKFSASGSFVEVRIGQQNGYASWKCTDQGPGIEASEQEKIFEPFYRGKHASRKDGTGLGLFIAKRIVDLHGGRIQATRNRTAGTTIEIHLPV